MRYSSLIASPSLNNDWNEFLQSKPDLTSVIEWLKNREDNNDLNIQTLFDINQKWSSDDPEEVFEESTLDEWAKENGYKQELTDFDDKDIFDHTRRFIDPETLYGYNRLEDWAIFNDYILKDKLVNIINESKLKNKDKIIDLLDTIND